MLFKKNFDFLKTFLRTLPKLKKQANEFANRLLQTLIKNQKLAFLKTFLRRLAIINVQTIKEI